MKVDNNQFHVCILLDEKELKKLTGKRITFPSKYSSHATPDQQTLPARWQLDMSVVTGSRLWQLPENEPKSPNPPSGPVVTPTDGADYAGVAGCDRLLVDVQQAEMLQEGVSHAGVQLLALNERVRHCHHIRVAPDESWGDKESVVRGEKLIAETRLRTPAVKMNEGYKVISGSVIAKNDRFRIFTETLTWH